MAGPRAVRPEAGLYHLLRLIQPQPPDADPHRRWCESREGSDPIKRDSNSNVLDSAIER
jgi:hypothetical protein